jgi:uncharacterized membrane protein
MQITNKTLYTNIALFAIYTVFSVITYIVTNNFLHIFLVWNLFLAAIPFGIVYFIDHKIIKDKLWIILSLLVWLFFFPNSIYIITDLIYIDVDVFVISGFGYDPTTFVQDIPSYLALFHIYLGSIIGLIYGFKSVNALYSLSKGTVAFKYRDLIAVLVFILSGLGIYIGRFFRYNSWEILKVFSIIKDFFSTFSWFTVFFILALTVIQVLIFYMFRFNFYKKK